MRVWLCRIAKNAYCTYIKKDRPFSRAEEAEAADIADPHAAIEADYNDREDAERIRKILRGIPDPYKEVFLWRVFGELSFKEIGNLCEKTENWACVTYHRARKIIQSKLEENAHEK